MPFVAFGPLAHLPEPQARTAFWRGGGLFWVFFFFGSPHPVRSFLSSFLLLCFGRSRPHRSRHTPKQLRTSPGRSRHVLRPCKEKGGRCGTDRSPKRTGEVGVPRRPLLRPATPCKRAEGLAGPRTKPFPPRAPPASSGPSGGAQRAPLSGLQGNAAAAARSGGHCGPEGPRDRDDREAAHGGYVRGPAQPGSRCMRGHAGAWTPSPHSTPAPPLPASNSIQVPRPAPRPAPVTSLSPQEMRLA